jgi:hypothetical protein
MHHTVVELRTFIASCDREGVSVEERFEIIEAIAADPQRGDLIPGTGGARKVRFAGKGRGKSGGYRTLHYFGGEDVPVFLLLLLSKGTRADISQAERNRLKALLSSLADEYRGR